MLISYRRMGNRGQFIPITVTIVTTTIFFLLAMINVFRVAKAKLEAQNLADSAALAIAAMQAKSINVVVDRNEWLNHLYSTNYTPGKNSLPGLSKRQKDFSSDPYAKEYAKLIAAVNLAQYKFIDKYNEFLGAGNATASGGANQAALQDILSEISGLYATGVRYWCWNTKGDEPDANQMQETQNSNAGYAPVIKMKELVFIPEPITITVKGKNPRPLSSLYSGPNAGPGRKMAVWLRPDWNANTLDIKSKSLGSNSGKIGVGVLVTKSVPTYFGLKTVYARSYAYVVRESGTADTGSGGTGIPVSFRPTFYVKLGVK